MPIHHKLKISILFSRDIVNEIQMQIADRAGIKISDSELNQTLSRIASQNNLSLEEFRVALEQEGDSYKTFRETIKKELIIQRVQRGKVGSRVDISEQELEKTKNLISAINSKESSIQSLSDGEFKEKTLNLKRSVQEGKSLENVIPESFALVREAAKRTLGERHYDVQLAGGIILHQGKIAEMKTGEGKTLVSTLPAYLNSLTGKGVHICLLYTSPSPRDRGCGRMPSSA